MKPSFVILLLLPVFGIIVLEHSTYNHGPVASAGSNNAVAEYWDTVIDGQSFAGYRAFEKTWNYLYPWGEDHNGSARMIAGHKKNKYVSLQKGNILQIMAQRIRSDKGNSSKDPFLKIRYYSGAVHARHQVTVSDQWPQYEVSGWFKAPVVKGSWPAFWLTAVHGWPPELDILEFKGDAVNWQNTFITPRQVTTKKVTIEDAPDNWHHYKAVLTKVSDTDLDITYYIDHQQTAIHRGNFMNKPLWIIINLQMEGSAGAPGPEADTYYYSKDIIVRRKGLRS